MSFSSLYLILHPKYVKVFTSSSIYYLLQLSFQMEDFDGKYFLSKLFGSAMWSIYCSLYM
jgi:hypothetical protein